MGFETEPLSFEGNGAAPGEGIKDGRGVPVARLDDLGVRFGEQSFVRGVLPDHKPLYQREEALAFRCLSLLGGELVGPAGGIINQLREQDCPAGRKGAAGPPQVQRGGVTVAYRLLPGRFAVDGFQGERDLDELAAVRESHESLRGQGSTRWLRWWARHAGSSSTRGWPRHVAKANWRFVLRDTIAAVTEEDRPQPRYEASSA
jgi:hypothetical protein